MTIDAIILAAGFSSRACCNKMLLKLNNKTIIEHCIESFQKKCSNIIVVTGHYHNDIQNIIYKYKNAKIVYNENYTKGMFSSVKTGIECVHSDRFFLTPGDYPLVNQDTISKMIESNSDIVIPMYNSKSGHPILLTSKMKNYILNSNKISLRECLTTFEKQRINTNDIGVITDVDTITDYENINNIYFSNF